jgi:hypothetical protein
MAVGGLLHLHCVLTDCTMKGLNYRALGVDCAVKISQPIFRTTAYGRTVWVFPETCLVTDDMPSAAREALPQLCSRQPEARYEGIKDFARQLSKCV